MTAEEVRATLQRMENVVGLLQLRERGARVAVPALIADASERQLAAILASDAALLAVHYQEASS